MKRFITFISRVKENPKIKMIMDIAMFYVMIMIIYVYLMWANLSTAPEFIYSQF